MKESKLANFREISMGDIVPGTLYRSSHPIKENREDPAVVTLASKARISTVINLHDTTSGLFSKTHKSPWYDNLYKSSCVIALGMDFSVISESFKKKLKHALQYMVKKEPPYLIHCHAGVDRTGFVCMVLESFMGAKLDEVIADYLKSFDSFYNSNIYGDKADRLTAVNVLSKMDSSQIITNDNLQSIAAHYLKNTIGLTEKEIVLLKRKLSGEKNDKSADRRSCTRFWNFQERDKEF